MKDKLLTKVEILERFKDIWELTDFEREELSEEVSEKIEVIFSLVQLFCDLQECRDFSEVRVIGFGAENDDEEDEGEGEE